MKRLLKLKSFKKISYFQSMVCFIVKLSLVKERFEARSSNDIYVSSFNIILVFIRVSLSQKTTSYYEKHVHYFSGKDVACIYYRVSHNYRKDGRSRPISVHFAFVTN